MATNKPFFIMDDDPPAKRKTLEVALKLFVQKGLCETTIRDVADETGYSNPALYKHFASKDKLVIYLFERCYERLYTDLQTAITQTSGFEGKLRAYLQRFTEIYDENPESVLFVNENLRRLWPQSGQRLRRYSLIGQMAALIESGRDDGFIDADIPPQLLVTLLGGTLQQFAKMMYFGEFHGRAQDWVESLVDLLRHMAKR